MYKIILAIVITLSALLTGCTRIETGEVGVRMNASKQIEPGEKLEGSWNQTLIGSILTFPIKEIAMELNDRTPMTSENTSLADFDATMIYNINASAVAELYSQKSKSLHYTAKDGDIYLMWRYMETLLNNAVYKAVRKYASLEAADKRTDIEQDVLRLVRESLQADKLDTALTVSSVRVRNVLPNRQILDSATQYVRAQNDLKTKQTEVEIAKKESERMAALSANSGTSIAYMNAQANMKIANGIENGKVQAIVVPMDFRGFVNFGK